MDVPGSDRLTANYHLPTTFLILLTGLLSIVAQVILLRELSAAFYGVDLVYLLALGAWLLWTAVGAVIGRRRLHPPVTHLAAVVVAVGLVIPLDVALVRRLRVLLGGVPGAYLPLPTQLAASTLCLAPASVLLGVLFQWAAKRYLTANPAKAGSHIVDAADYRPTLARAYAIESVGGVLGGLVTTLTLHWRVPNLALALAAAGLAFAASGFIAPAFAHGSPHEREASRSPFAAARWIVALIGVPLCLVAGLNTAGLDRWMTSWTHPDVVATLDSPYGRVTLTERAGQVSAYENDALVLDSEATDAEEFAHLSLLQHAAPRRVLLVAGATSGLLPHVEQHDPDRIDDLELDTGVVDLLARHLPAIGQSLSSPVLHSVFDDPRRAIAGCASAPTTGAGRTAGLACHDGYDVIVVAAPEPASAQANRFFTREFFESCAARLRPGGLVAFRLSSIENLWTPALVARTGSIYLALRDVFQDVVVLPGDTNIVLASASPLTRDPQVLAERLGRRGIGARMVTPRYVRYLYSNDRFAEIDALLRRYRARPNTDANAASYQATAVLWLSKFVPALGRLDLARAGESWRWSAPRSWLLLAAATALAWLWRRRNWGRRAALVGIAAFGGMVLETLLLLTYQLKHGVVFQDLGVLLMSVMAGLAAGAWLADRPAAGANARLARMRLPFGGLTVLAILVSLTIETGYGAGFLPIAIMLFATGAAVAAVFAFASAAPTRPTRPTSPTRPIDPRLLVSPLYAADVLGGCLGAVAASLLLVPLLGLPLTGQWTGALGVVALLLAW